MLQEYLQDYSVFYIIFKDTVEQHDSLSFFGIMMAHVFFPSAVRSSLFFYLQTFSTRDFH